MVGFFTLDDVARDLSHLAPGTQVGTVDIEIYANHGDRTVQEFVKWFYSKGGRPISIEVVRKKIQAMGANLPKKRGRKRITIEELAKGNWTYSGDTLGASNDEKAIIRLARRLLKRSPLGENEKYKKLARDGSGGIG